MFLRVSFQVRGVSVEQVFPFLLKHVLPPLMHLNFSLLVALPREMTREHTVDVRSDTVELRPTFMTVSECSGHHNRLLDKKPRGQHLFPASLQTAAESRFHEAQ